MKYINDFRDGDRISGIYLCKQKTAAVTRNGKPYENLVLQDKTGCIDSKIWDPNSQGIADFEALDFVEITGEVTTFSGSLQMNIRRLRKAAFFRNLEKIMHALKVHDPLLPLSGSALSLRACGAGAAISSH